MTNFSQAIRFCTTADGVQLAYASSGQGYALVKTSTWLTHLDFDWQSPVWIPWLRAFSERHTFFRYDTRGCGLSDWNVDRFEFDAWFEDLETVIKAAKLERFALLGMSQGGPIALAYAVKYPEKVSHLILYGAYARGALHRNLTAREHEERDLLLNMVRVGWGKNNPAFRQAFTSLFVPEGTKEQMDWFNELQRISTTPENAARIIEGFSRIDVQELARRVSTPTLVLHAKGDARIPFREGRLLAGLIPNARFVPLESNNHVLLETEPAWQTFLSEVDSFLGNRVSEPSPQEVERLTQAEPRHNLSEREQAVLALALAGMNNKEIAKKLFLTPKTVRNYMSILYSKFGVHSRSELIVALQQHTKSKST